jgi:hypothetical protein
MKRTDSQLAAYPIVANEVATLSVFPAYPAINDKPSAYTTPADGINPLVLGQHVVDKYGHSYIYVRADEALVVGQVVTILADPAESAILATDTVADNIHVLKTTNASLVAGAEVGNFLHIANSTGSVGDLKLIKANTTSTATPSTYFTISMKNTFQGRPVYDGDAPAAAYIVATSEIALIRPYHVEVAGDNEAPYGVAMGTVTSGNNTLVQIEGLAMVLATGGVSFTDLAPVYTAAAGVVDITDPLTGPGMTARVGFSRCNYGGANGIKIPVHLQGISCKW